MLCDPLYSIGNAFSDDDDTLFSELENTMIIAKQRISTDYGCEKCFLKSVCGHGCMGAASVLTGDPLGDDGECSYRKSVCLGFELEKKI